MKKDEDLLKEFVDRPLAEPLKRIEISRCGHSDPEDRALVSIDSGENPLTN